jgi:HK97 family phage portal protein
VTATSAGQSLVETLAAHLLLNGNGYVQILKDAAGTPVELFALRPDRVRVVLDGNGWPCAYDYTVAGDTTRLPVEDENGWPGVVAIRTMHPLDDHVGAGALEAAWQAVLIHNAATAWNRALLENAARPSGALVYETGDGATLAHEQFERLKRELDIAFTGAANAGRPMLLDGGLKWQSMALTPADMDFATLKSAAARDIALAFGVPPMLLGIPGDNTYANYREANRALWRLTLLPLAEKLFAALREGLAPWFPDARLGIDLDRVPALSEDRERLWTQVAGADFLSNAEKRQMLGLPPEEDAL